ncbi:MAG: hypothetical protein CL521_04000 [Actinobacteria bacterium]|nr:hypothetical protein [Actinomycetota bacterium]
MKCSCCRCNPKKDYLVIFLLKVWHCDQCQVSLQKRSGFAYESLKMLCASYPKETVFQAVDYISDYVSMS